MTMLRRLVAGALLLALSTMAARAASPPGCMPTTGVYSGVQFAGLINSALLALRTNNGGATAPADDCTGAPVAGQLWFDTSLAKPGLRLWDGQAADLIGRFDTNNHLFLPQLGGGLASLASGATTDLCSTPEDYLTITGFTTISSFGASCVLGQIKVVNFAGVLALAYSPSGILLPTAASITTQAGDQVTLVYTGGGVWRVTSYQRADGTALNAAVIPPVHYVGEDVAMRTSTCPANTLPEYGQAVSRTTYATLYAALGTTWGTGDGSTTFNLPNTSGMFDRGWVPGQTNTYDTLASRAMGTYQADMFQNHNVSSYGSFSDYYQYAYATGTVPDPANGGAAPITSITNAGAYTSNGVSSNGSPNSGNYGAETRPRNITVLHCIFLTNTP